MARIYPEDASRADVDSIDSHFAHRTTHRLIGWTLGVVVVGQLIGSALTLSAVDSHHGATVAAPVTESVEADAWAAWDALGQTADGERVVFEAASPSPLPPVDGTRVILHEGVYYQFSITTTP